MSSSVAVESPLGSREAWFCHCCRYENKGAGVTCGKCGRHESYALEGFPLPLHGKGGALFRPSQIINVLTEINEIDDINWTPLHNACVTGNTATVSKLLELGAFIEATTDKGQTPLHLAVYAGSKSSVVVLLANGANPNPVTRNEFSSPLHMACQGGLREIVLCLLAAGANPNVYDRLERSPLHLAALEGRADIGAALIRDGAKIEDKDCHGWNARQFAELRAHREFVELIVRNSQFEDKMVVLKEMPTAEWHCHLWTEVVETTQRSTREAIEMERKLKQFQDEVRIARERAIHEREGQADLERRARLEDRDRQRKVREEMDLKAREFRRSELEVCPIAVENAALFGAGTRKSENRGRERGDGRSLGATRVLPPASLLGLNRSEFSELKATNNCKK